MTTDPHQDWPVDFSAALAEAVAKVREIRGPLPPAGIPRQPANHPPGDLTEGDLAFGGVTGQMRRCRVCDQGIHTGRPVVSHWPHRPSISCDSYHPDCVKDVLP